MEAGGYVMERPSLSVVVPVFNEQEAIGAFYTRLRSVIDSLTMTSYEVIFVDDGSSDGSYERLLNLAQRERRVSVIKFSRNFGHQIAITAGIDRAKGDAVVVIDADLQDPPEVISEFVRKWEQGYDVVYGIRDKREGESRLKLITAAAYYRVLQRMIKLNVPVDVGDFRLMDRRVVERFKELRERDRFVRGLVSWIGLKQTGVHYSRDKRYAGETKYPYFKMIRFALDGITSFSDLPLKLATWFGYVTSAAAFLYACSVVVQKALGYTVQGWATIMVATLFLGGVQLISLGIIGEYLGRVFNEVKARPLYVIDEIYEAEPGSDTDVRPQISRVLAASSSTGRG